MNGQSLILEHDMEKFTVEKKPVIKKSYYLVGKENEFLKFCIKSKEERLTAWQKSKGKQKDRSKKKRAQSPSNFSEQKSMPFAVSDSMLSVFRVWNKARA